MRLLKTLISSLGLKSSKPTFERIAKAAGVAPDLVKYWEIARLAPSEIQLSQICREFEINPVVVKLRMGLIDEGIRQFLTENAEQFLTAVPKKAAPGQRENSASKVLATKYGELYQGDCLNLMSALPAGFFNLIFADPPFNLNKKYPSKIDDALKAEEYLIWCYSWLDECIRLLAPGGSLFVYNLPKWNTAIAEYLNARLNFRDWVAIDIKFSLPIANRLYPSHYSLLYYANGLRPGTFKPDRLPMEICPNCMKDLKDYGGYKDKMNPLGINLTDVWYDIPPVRHKQTKKRSGANELPVKMLDRIIEMASNEGDHIFDPFGGSGCTYAVAEVKKRKWTGIEIGPVSGIIDRLHNLESDRQAIAKYRADYNCLFRSADKSRRAQMNLWTDETVRQESQNKIRHNGDILTITGGKVQAA